MSIGVYGVFTRAYFTNAQRKKKGLTEAELETTFEEDVRKAKLRMFATIEHRKKNYVQRSKKFDMRQREKEMEQEQKMRDMLKEEKHWSKGREHRVSVWCYEVPKPVHGLNLCVVLRCVFQVGNWRDFTGGPTKKRKVRGRVLWSVGRL